MEKQNTGLLPSNSLKKWGDPARVHVIALLHPFNLANRVLIDVDPGQTVQEILDTLNFKPRRGFEPLIQIENWNVPRETWGRVKPRSGRTITIRVLPRGGGGGKDVLRAVAFVAVVAASFAVPAGLGLTTVIGGVSTLSLSGALLAAGIGIVGNLLINALIPPPGLDLNELGGGGRSLAYSLSGTRNQLNPWGVIPKIYGKHRVYPVLGAQPFTEAQGDRQYIRLLFVVGHGPLALSDFKIGETPLGEFQGVEMEIRNGFSSDTDISLFNNIVNEDPFSILLSKSRSWVTRRTDEETDEISVDIQFPLGLYNVQSDGTRNGATVEFEIQYQEVGAGSWKTFHPNADDPIKALYVDALVDGSFDAFEGTITFHKHNALFVFSQVEITGSLPNVSLQLTESFQIVCNSDGSIDFYDGLASLSGSTQYTVNSATLDVTTQEGFISEKTLVIDGTEGTITISSKWEMSAEGKFVLNPDGLTDITVTEKKISPFTRGYKWRVANGQYDVRIRRITADANSEADRIYWTALRSIKNDPPINKSGLALIAMRIQATEQLNGTVDQLNCIAESIVEDWDNDTSSWIERISQNPASHFRNILQGNGKARPLADARIDLAGLQTWHEWCNDNGYTFNGIFDTRRTTYDALRAVAAAGRASPNVKDSLYTVIQDVQQSTPVQHFTPRNSFGFKIEQMFKSQPHALRVRYVNEDSDYQQDEITVYDDGYNVGNATEFENLDLFGVTNTDQAWKLARYHMAVSRLRPATYSLGLDFEHLVCNRGDLVKVTHDVAQWGLGFARVTSITTNGGGDLTGFSIDDLFTMEAGSSYGVRFRKADGTSVTATLTTNAGSQSDLTLSAAIDSADPQPAVGDLVMFGLLSQESVNLLVKSIEPTEEFGAVLTLVDESPSVYTADSGTIPDYDPQITASLPFQLPAPPKPAIQSIISDESVLLVNSDGTLKTRIVVSLKHPMNAEVKPSFYQAEYRVNTGDDDVVWTRLPIIPASSSEFSILDVEDGEAYGVRIRSVSEAGRVSEWNYIASHTVIGKSTPPGNVDALYLENGILRWEYEDPPIDLAGFLIRYRTGTVAQWENAIKAHAGVISDTQFDISAIPSGQKTFMIKAVDTSGNESSGIAVLYRDLGDQEISNIIDTRDYQAEGWLGTISNASISGSDLVADDDGGLFWTDDNNYFWSGDSAALFWKTTYLQMYYQDTYLPDADKVPATLTIDSTMIGSAYEILYRTQGNQNFWSNDSAYFWTDDSNLFWTSVGEFKPWPGLYEFKNREKLDIKALIDAGGVQGQITELSAVLDVPDIEEEFEDVAIGSGGTRLSLTETYRSIVTVLLTLQDDGGSATTLNVVDKDPDLGPLIKAYDSGGSPTTALIDARIRGY